MSNSIPLEHLVTYQKGKPSRSDILNDSDVVPIITPDYLRTGTPSEFTPRKTAYRLLQSGEIVLLWDGSNAGEFFRARHGTLASTMVVLRFSQTDLDGTYLFYEFKRFEPELKSKTAGSGIPHVDKAVLLSHEINCPPKQYQQKIAEVLTAVDRVIEQTQALIAKYQRIKAGLMQDLLTRGLDENGNLRPVSAADKHFFSNWPLKPLGQVAEVASGVTLGRKVAESANTVSLPYLRVFNVQDGYLDLSDVKTVTVYRTEVGRFELRKGDVLMNEGGDFDKLGRGTVWEGLITPCLHQNHVFRVRTNPEILNPYFLSFICMSPYGKRFFVLSSKQSTNLASINSTQLKSFPVPCPPINEQLAILRVFNAQDQAIHSEAAHLTNLKRVKSGLMQDLLTGKVSVSPLLASENPSAPASAHGVATP